MYLLQTVLLTFGLLVSCQAFFCPPPAELLPCKCYDDDGTLACSVRNDPSWDIKGTMDNISLLFPDDFVLEHLEIAYLALKEIPAGAFETIKAKHILIVLNSDLEYIHPGAFNATLEYTTGLAITENKLLSNVETPDPIFNVVRKFKKLKTLNLSKNAIKSIPDNALASLLNLEYFNMGPSGQYSQLMRVGSKAFAGLPNLGRLDLNGIDISADEIAEDAFEGISSNAVVNLQSNSLGNLPEATFKPLLNTVKSVWIGETYCPELGPCYYQQFACNDEASQWICEDVDKYEQVLTGFLCTKPTLLPTIFDYCRWHNNQTELLV